MNSLKSKLITVIILTVFIAVMISGCIGQNDQNITTNNLKQFASYDELNNFVKTTSEGYDGYGNYKTLAMDSGTQTAAPTVGGARDYSTTNIQVFGVDEADIVKNDGKYIYMVSNNKIEIVDAYPAETMGVKSEIEFNGSVQEVFVNNDKLVVFGNNYGYYPIGLAKESIRCLGCGYGNQESFVKIYDISDRSSPKLVKDITMNSSYYDSRMIGDNVYVIMQESVYMLDGAVRVPAILEDGVAKDVSLTNIYYFNQQDSSYNFNTVLDIDLNTLDYNQKTYLLGYNQNLYVSQNNIYLVSQKYVSYRDYQNRLMNEIILPNIPADVADDITVIMSSNMSDYEKYGLASEMLRNYTDSFDPEQGAVFMKDLDEKRVQFDKIIEKEREKTIIHRINIANGIEYGGKGEVSGYTLNQFSMDEYNGYFRIVTTTSWGDSASNHLYVLDDSLNMVGKVEDLAPGERIYSSRFLGEKLYMVTFRQVDPLFVIDMSVPSDPKVLGFLKIPGVSDYLHPYDQNHIIGIGRDANEDGRITGMKVALFDVTDPSNPIEQTKYIIGDRGSYSEALNDHKAFLFSKEKNLMIIPVTVYEKGKQEWPEFSWQGAYVFNIDENGFELKGKITHDIRVRNESYWYDDYQSQIRRSLYMDNILYTVSNNMIKASSLLDLIEISNVTIDVQEQSSPIYINDISIEQSV
ncbi:MAG: beta-propeller domain-containing protein [Candidatus Aenigmatarchaeota archaeon]